MHNPFTRHPAEVGETYVEHFAVASGFGLRLLTAAGASFLHALLPFACKTTGSRAVADLHRMLSERNAGRGPDRTRPPRRTLRSAASAPVRQRQDSEARRALRELI